MAKVFLETGDDYRVVNDNTTVYGVAGDETDSVIIESDATDVTVNANVDRVDFAGSIADFTFQTVFGANLLVYAADGTTLIASIPLQEDADGTQLVFSDGAIDAIYDGTVTAGGIEITDTAAAITPDAADIDETTTTEADVEPVITNPQLSVSTADVAEGETATFTVTLDEAQTEAVTVDYTISYEGDATADDIDLADLTGTLTFAAGDTTQTVEVPTVNDDISPEDGEGLTITLTNVNGADAEIDVDAATANITDVPNTFELTQTPSSVTEGGTVIYTVTAAAPVLEDTDVAFVVVPGDSAADDQGSDQTNMNDFDQGSFNPYVVTILAGETSIDFELVTQNDGVTELPENYSVEAEVRGETLTIDTTLLDGSQEGQTFILTTGIDVPATTIGNDTILGLLDGADNTYTLGDIIDGNDGNDTFILTTDFAVLDMALADVANVENLEINAASDLGTIDLDDVAYDSVLLNGNIGGVASDGFVATSAFTQTGLDAYDSDITADGETSTIEITVEDTVDGSATWNFELDGSTLDTIVNLNSMDDTDFYLYVDNTDGSGDYTDLMTTLNIEDVNDAAIEIYYGNTDEFVAEGINYTEDISISGADDIGVYTYFYHDGASPTDITIDVSDSDGVYYENESNDVNDVAGTTAIDTATLILDNVTSDDNDSEFYFVDIETLNVEVISDSEVYYIGSYYYEDGPTMDPNVINIDLNNADLLVDYLDFNDDADVDGELNVTGTGNLTVDWLDDGNSDLVVDATGLVGDFWADFHNGDYLVSAHTGIGNDTLILDTFMAEVSTGAGDDTVAVNDFDFGDADAETVDGGDGTDTVAIMDSSNIDAAFMANIQNFETLEIAGANNVAAYDMDVMGFTDIRLTETAAAVVPTITNIASDAVLTITAIDADTALTGPGALVYTPADASAADDTAVVVMNATDSNDDQTAEGQAAAAIDITQDGSGEGVEIVSLTSNATTASEESVAGADDALTSADYTNILGIDATEMTTLNIDGNAMAEVVCTDITGLTFIDATGSEAGVTIDASVGGAVAGITFNGSDAADTYTATANGDLIQANDGADDLTFGAGDDTVRYVVASDSQLTLTDDDDDDIADTASGYDVVTDFGASGTDLIELSSQLGLATGDARTEIIQHGDIDDGTDAATTAAELQALIGDGVDFFSDGLVDRATAFAFDDNATAADQGFLFVDVNSDGDFTEADDMMIELAGVTALNVTDIQFG